MGSLSEEDLLEAQRRRLSQARQLRHVQLEAFSTAQLPPAAAIGASFSPLRPTILCQGNLNLTCHRKRFVFSSAVVDSHVPGKLGPMSYEQSIVNCSMPS